ncbi:GNAT family N-acetyltransferase [Paenibacillus kandeliae]|uniref:GNAT family N-acetyltransferase n=1 Tax=Paenibacillus kandeliae TaxID=3231269 RepID=UPI0034578285
MKNSLTLSSDARDLIYKTISIDDLPDIKAFTCGNSSMDYFLIQESYPSHIERESSTTLIYSQNKLIGYYTLRHTALSSLLPTLTPDKDIQILDIARLAIAQPFQGKGYGTEIMNTILHMAVQFNERYIVLDAIKDVAQWYKDHFRFEHVFDQDLIDDTPVITLLLDLYDKELVEQYYDE